MHVMPQSLLKRGIAPKGAYQSLDDQLWHVKKILGKLFQESLITQQQGEDSWDPPHIG